jgi:hypothetical protein
MRKYLLFVHVSMLIVAISFAAKEDDGGEKDKWKKKHITDYNDADLERLYEQWEVCFGLLFKWAWLLAGYLNSRKCSIVYTVKLLVESPRLLLKQVHLSVTWLSLSSH